jgi:hypothetical protein
MFTPLAVRSINTLSAHPEHLLPERQLFGETSLEKAA